MIIEKATMVTDLGVTETFKRGLALKAIYCQYVIMTNTRKVCIGYMHVPQNLQVEIGRYTKGVYRLKPQK